MAKIPFSVSFYDVDYVLSEIDKTTESLSPEEIKEVLFYLGMEAEGVEIEEVIHRPIHSPNNKAWQGKRFIGMERQDKEWLYSGKSSLENVIASQTDMSHKRDLVMMSQQRGCGVAEYGEAMAHSKKSKQ